MAVGKVLAHLCLILIVKESKIKCCAKRELLLELTSHLSMLNFALGGRGVVGSSFKT